MFLAISTRTMANARQIVPDDGYQRRTPKRDALIAASLSWAQKKVQERRASQGIAERRAIAHEARRRAEATPRDDPMPLAVLIDMIATWHGVTAADITGLSRERHIFPARFDAIAAVWFARPDFSLPQIGRVFGRDHTSILHALRKRGLK